MTQQVSNGVYVEWSASGWLAEVTAKREALQDEYAAAYRNFDDVTKTAYTADELSAADNQVVTAAEAVLSVSRDESHARHLVRETK